MLIGSLLRSKRQVVLQRLDIHPRRAGVGDDLFVSGDHATALSFATTPTESRHPRRLRRNRVPTLNGPAD